MAYAVKSIGRLEVRQTSEKDDWVMSFLVRVSITLMMATALIPERAETAFNYADVAVIVNINSPASVSIGDYFRQARSIPAGNMVYVSTSVAEEIDSSTFNALRAQIESHLVTHNLVNTINYIVTTKGVPLKVNRGDTFSLSSPSSSVESELTCLLGGYGGYIGGMSRISSPYYNAGVHFTRNVYGIYLVTRLDAYTVEQVFALIDNSGPGLSSNPASTFVLDQDPAWNTSLPSLNTNLATAAVTLSGRGKSVLLNQDTAYVTSQSNVQGYASWGSNDHYDQYATLNAITHNSWAHGAIAETYVSTSGRTFDAPAEYGQSLVADMIAEGLSGAKGYVYEPYSSSMAAVNILFDCYTNGYNLAESFYQASRYLSWMDVIIGDPKTSIDGSNGPLPVQMAYLHIGVSPDGNGVTLDWGTLTEVNNYGFVVQMRDTTVNGFRDVGFVPGHQTTVEPQSYAWTSTELGSGTYAFRLRQVDMDNSWHDSEEQVVTVPSHTTSVAAGGVPFEFTLDQNFPNPFNPSTTLHYRTASYGHVELTIYTELGQHVATLVNGDQASGDHSVVFSVSPATKPASGVYFAVLRAGSDHATRKMILIK